LCAANKQIRRVHERHGVYKAGVVRRVNTGPTREGNARIWSVNPRRFKAEDRDLRAPISLRSPPRGTKGRARARPPRSGKSLRHAPDSPARVIARGKWKRKQLRTGPAILRGNRRFAHSIRLSPRRGSFEATGVTREQYPTSAIVKPQRHVFTSRYNIAIAENTRSHSRIRKKDR